MPVGAFGSRPLLSLVHRTRVGVAERAGELLGGVAAPLFAKTSALRSARTFHPRGDCADAEVSVAASAPWEYRRLAERLAGHAFVRFSDALTKKKARWPDVLGCAIRFSGELDDAARLGDQDLLFATIRRPWTMPFSPFTTRVGDYLANDYFGVSPFAVAVRAESVRSDAPRVWLRLRPTRREPGAVVTTSSGAPISSLRASPFAPLHAAAERRRRRLERAIASGDAALVLGVGRSPWGPFAPLVRIQLESIRLHDPADFAFDPYRCARGIEPQGFVHALRRGAYAASRRARLQR